MHKVRLAAAVAVLVLAGIGYGLFIPVTHVARAQLSQLTVARPPGGFRVKPKTSGVVPATESLFPTLKEAAKRSPDQTGAYSVEWTGSTSSTDIVSMLVSLLPSHKEAAAVQAEAHRNYVEPDSFKADSYVFHGSFKVPGVPNASGALYSPTSSAKTTKPVAAVVFHAGDVAVTQFVINTAQVKKTEATAVSLARDQYQHLQSTAPGFSLQETSFPFVTSLIYWVAAVGIAAALYFAPVVVDRMRQRRRLARREAEQKALRRRGRKVVKRHAYR